MKNFKKTYFLTQIKFHFSNWQDWLQPFLFYLIIFSLFSISFSDAPKQLKLIYPAVFWIATFLAHILSLNLLFQDDFDDGTILYNLLQPIPFETLVWIKILVHNLFFLGLAITTQIFAIIFFKVSLDQIVKIILISFFCIPGMTSIGALISALIVASRKNWLLLITLIIPFYIPIFLFAQIASQKSEQHLPINGELALLAAIVVASLLLVPKAVVKALRLSL